MNMNQDINNVSVQELTYEQKINIMNVDKYIKDKAISKYKEIVNKGNENGKAQQYLDGLLKIPFKIYRKEPIFSKLEEITDEINNISNKKLKTRNDIEIFLIYLHNEIYHNEKINHLIQSINYKNYKLKELKNIIENINDLFKTNIIFKNIKKEYLLDNIKKYLIKHKNSIKNKGFKIL